jgi:MFS family permease
MAEKFTWNYAFNIFGIVGVLYSIFLIFTLKEAPSVIVPEGSRLQKQESIRFGNVIRALFSKISFVYLLCFWCMMGVVGWLVMGWLPTYYKEQFHLSQTVAGLYATAYMYPMSIVGLLAGGFFADRWIRTHPYARILVPVIGLGIAAPCVFFASYATALTVVVVFFAIYALTRMSVDANLMPVLCMAVDTRYRATGYGIMNMLATIVGGIGIYAAGALRDSHINLGVIFRCASLTIIVCVVLLTLVKKNISKCNINTNNREK